MPSLRAYVCWALALLILAGELPRASAQVLPAPSPLRNRVLEAYQKMTHRPLKREDKLARLVRRLRGA